jgi:hypothetical protein
LEGLNDTERDQAIVTPTVWSLIAEDDRMINPITQRFMAERMGAALRSYDVDHTPSLTAPQSVIEVILEAAQATLSA